MPETEEFLAATTPRMNAAERALHEGDAGPRRALWSHADDVTLYGAVVSARGWDEIAPIFDELARGFSNVTRYENEIIAAGASGDLAYIVALEHAVLSVAGRPPQAQLIRATTLFRRENGEWRAIHRHGDLVTPQFAPTMGRLSKHPVVLPATNDGIDILRRGVPTPRPRRRLGIWPRRRRPTRTGPTLSGRDEYRGRDGT